MGFHFVKEYEALVGSLMANHPLDEAMSLAVGGDFKQVGELEKAVLIYAGLQDGMALIDYGCGSGRLAHALGAAMRLNYLGVDIIDPLLEYAKSKSPTEYVFLNHRELNVPAADESADMICAFSLFTHLLQTQAYLYMEDMFRVLKPGGRLVFTFLEFAHGAHWPVFKASADAEKAGSLQTLNLFMERVQIECWAGHLGYRVVEFIDGATPCFGGSPLGQSLAILERSMR